MMSLPCDGERNLGGADHGLDIHGAEIVAIQVDIQNADRNLAILERLDFRGQPLRQRNAAAANADERELIEVLGLLQNLVREADQRPIDLGRAHELGFFAGEGHIPAVGSE